MIAEFSITFKIPPTMNTSMITLILKPNKDPTHPANYRPLSLINTDIKIISKTLASRIEVMPSLIHPDQTGFIKGGQLSINTHKLRSPTHPWCLSQHFGLSVQCQKTSHILAGHSFVHQGSHVLYACRVMPWPTYGKVVGLSHDKHQPLPQC